MSSSPPQNLDLLAAPLADTVLIEASAGTGKTYTITGLILRLICEGQVTIDQVLVVTYTVAATAELRDRVRHGLTSAVEAFERGEAKDPLLAGLLEHCGADREQALLHLAAAVANFDAVAIYTIHGFCQRALADYAFEGGLPFALDMLLDDGPLLTEIVRDFWRQQIYGAPAHLVQYLRGKGHTPETLVSWVRQLVEKPFLQVRAPEAVALAELGADFDAAFDEAGLLWQQHRGEVSALLLDNTGLNGNRYRKTSLPGWLELLDQYLQAKLGDPAGFKQLEKFGTAVLAASARKGKSPPQHRFFDSCQVLEERRQALYQGLESHWRCLLRELLRYCDEQLHERKQRSGQQSFGDLLLRLSGALQGDDGDRLALALRQRYRAALIDEFQDTDPIQYEIFARIYRGSGLPVYLVGDPKQAIYSFRGADIFTYLNGRNDARHAFTLRDNWRSTPAMINAVNSLFMASERPFWFSAIPFAPATVAPREHGALLLRGQPDPSPLKVWLLDRRSDGKLRSVGDATDLAIEAVASEIARLLNDSAAGEALLGERALEGSDIAVLVRSHRQAQRVRSALASRGIASVEQSQDSVFHAPEAEYLEQLLAALVEPRNPGRVRAALVTPLFGLDGHQLLALEEDEFAWEKVLDDFLRWHDQWRQRGLMVALRELMEQRGVASRLLRRQDGHRRLTDLRHLLELLQARLRMNQGMEALVRWLAEQRQGDGSRGEETQLRLENDEQLVKIVTVHKSKGLQYAVVFCPFVWHGAPGSSTDETPTIHDPAQDYRAMLDLSGDPEVRQLAQQEELAENLRLLYVALTRAEYRCYLAWGAINQAGQSALGWLLHGGAPGLHDDAGAGAAMRLDLDALGSAVAALTLEELRQRIQQLAAEAGGAIEVLDLEAQIDHSRYSGAGDVMQLVDARRFPGLRVSPWRVTSYTGLSRHRSSVVDGRDYDLLGADSGADERAATENTIHTFPRGARAGQCLHTIFERIDFARPGGAEGVALVEDTLGMFGYDKAWQPVVSAMVGDVLAASMDRAATIQLAALPRRHRLTEMEFHFPIAAISGAGLRRAVRALEPASQPLASLDFTRVAGFMKGFIDLVFQAGERFYIVDYKSNWLGAAATDYHEDALAEAMAQADYHWQYLIYCVALHRYLRLRVPGYDYERHMGGVFYLFLRGVVAGPGGDTGVYRCRPELALIEALDQYFEVGDGH